MEVTRRDFIFISGAVAATIAIGGALPVGLANEGDRKMYGLIGKMLAVPGERDALIAILLEGTKGMPGCLSYVVAKDAADENAIWISEVWDSEESHAASLVLPSVKEAIARGRPLIAGFGERFITAPVGGQGLPASRD